VKHTTCSLFNNNFTNKVLLHECGSLYHGMARPHVADGGTASDMEGSCE
jgi:hypothetical protein